MGRSLGNESKSFAAGFVGGIAFMKGWGSGEGPGWPLGVCIRWLYGGRWVRRVYG